MRILVILFVLFAFLSTPRIISAATIKINEFYAAGSTRSNSDWVEVYNEGFDISLYQLIDAANNKKDLANSSCNGSFCTIDWYNSLNNGGDTIKLVLKASPATSIDEITYPSNITTPSSGQSAGRNPDGTGGWIIFITPTKGSTNGTSTPTPSPTSTPAPSSSPTSSPSSSSFTISNSPSEINSNQSFSIPVSLSLPNNSNTVFYLKGAFKKSDSSNYFGLTKVSGSWIKNSSAYQSQYPITTDSSGNWSGNIEIKPDSEDSGFIGSGDYIFKVGRYTSSGSGPIWSNEVTVRLVSVTQGSDSVETIITTNSPSPNITPIVQATSYQTKTVSKTEIKMASIAGITATATPSALPVAAVKSQKQINFPQVIGIILIIVGIGLPSFIYLRNHANIFNKFGKRD